VGDRVSLEFEMRNGRATGRRLSRIEAPR